MADDTSKMLAARASEELHDGREAPVVMAVDPKDGMPVQVPQANFDSPPGLSPENLVCMADTSSFVERDVYGEVLRTWPPSEVTRTADGAYLAKDGGDPNTRVVVEPIRPACQNYLRQMTDITADREHRFIQRACLAQRSETGEYLSLRDGAVFACSLRSPRDLKSEALLDDFDNGKMADEQKKQEMASFDVDAELAKQSLGVLGDK